jgi:hypothetical protein
MNTEDKKYMPPKRKREQSEDDATQDFKKRRLADDSTTIDDEKIIQIILSLFKNSKAIFTYFYLTAAKDNDSLKQFYDRLKTTAKQNCNLIDYNEILSSLFNLDFSLFKKTLVKLLAGGNLSTTIIKKLMLNIIRDKKDTRFAAEMFNVMNKYHHNIELELYQETMQLLFSINDWDSIIEIYSASHNKQPHDEQILYYYLSALNSNKSYQKLLSHYTNKIRHNDLFIQIPIKIAIELIRACIQLQKIQIAKNILSLIVINHPSQQRVLDNLKQTLQYIIHSQEFNLTIFENIDWQIEANFDLPATPRTPEPALDEVYYSDTVNKISNDSTVNEHQSRIIEKIVSLCEKAELKVSNKFEKIKNTRNFEAYSRCLKEIAVEDSNKEGIKIVVTGLLKYNFHTGKILFYQLLEKKLLTHEIIAAYIFQLYGYPSQHNNSTAQQDSVLSRDVFRAMFILNSNTPHILPDKNSDPDRHFLHALTGIYLYLDFQVDKRHRLDEFLAKTQMLSTEIQLLETSKATFLMGKLFAGVVHKCKEFIFPDNSGRANRKIKHTSPHSIELIKEKTAEFAEYLYDNFKNKPALDAYAISFYIQALAFSQKVSTRLKLKKVFDEHYSATTEITGYFLFTVGVYFDNFFSKEGLLRFDLDIEYLEALLHRILSKDNKLLKSERKSITYIGYKYLLFCEITRDYDKLITAYHLLKEKNCLHDNHLETYINACYDSKQPQLVNLLRDELYYCDQHSPSYITIHKLTKSVECLVSIKNQNADLADVWKLVIRYQSNEKNSPSIKKAIVVNTLNSLSLEYKKYEKDIKCIHEYGCKYYPELQEEMLLFLLEISQFNPGQPILKTKKEEKTQMDMALSFASTAPTLPQEVEQKDALYSYANLIAENNPPYASSFPEWDGNSAASSAQSDRLFDGETDSYFSFEM